MQRLFLILMLAAPAVRAAGIDEGFPAQLQTALRGGAAFRAGLSAPPLPPALTALTEAPPDSPVLKIILSAMAFRLPEDFQARVAAAAQTGDQAAQAALTRELEALKPENSAVVENAILAWADERLQNFQAARLSPQELGAALEDLRPFALWSQAVRSKIRTMETTFSMNTAADARSMAQKLEQASASDEVDPIPIQAIQLMVDYNKNLRASLPTLKKFSDPYQIQALDLLLAAQYDLDAKEKRSPTTWGSSALLAFNNEHQVSALAKLIEKKAKFSLFHIAPFSNQFQPEALQVLLENGRNPAKLWDSLAKINSLEQVDLLKELVSIKTSKFLSFVLSGLIGGGIGTALALLMAARVLTGTFESYPHLINVTYALSTALLALLTYWIHRAWIGHKRRVWLKAHAEVAELFEPLK